MKYFGKNEGLMFANFKTKYIAKYILAIIEKANFCKRTLQKSWKS